MLERAVAFVPALGKLPILRVWTGFRPATPDGLPLIGRWVDGVWIAAGHEGLGITTALGTAELLTALLMGAPAPIDAAPFVPTRAGAVMPGVSA
jgi:D-hydroxyproline dehydrogenase subunit beta